MLRDILQNNDDIEKISYTPIHPYEVDRHYVHKLVLDFVKSNSNKSDVFIYRTDDGFMSTIDSDYCAIVAIDNIIRINIVDIDIDNVNDITRNFRFFNVDLKEHIIRTNIEVFPDDLLYLINNIYSILGIA